jgi:hypothetical protein
MQMYWPHYPSALLLPSFGQVCANIAKQAGGAAALKANGASPWHNGFAAWIYTRNQPEQTERPGQFVEAGITKAQSVRTAPLHL